MGKPRKTNRTSPRARAPKMEFSEEIKRMVLSFRVTELQILLLFAGQNSLGRKNELQARVLGMISLDNPAVVMKIKEIYQEMRQRTGPSVEQCSSTVVSSSHTDGTEMLSLMDTEPQQSGYNHKGLPLSPLTLTLTRQPGTGFFLPSQSYNPRSSAMLKDYPIQPDVTFKSLPFYSLISVLLKPSSLFPLRGIKTRFHESTFVFHLTPHQVSEISQSWSRTHNHSGYTTQVQLRFCLMETSCDQDDCYPPGLLVRINNKTCALPAPVSSTSVGKEPKRPSRPLNITPYVKLYSSVANSVVVTWVPEGTTTGYAVAIFLVYKNSSSDLLQQLKAKGIRHADYTRGLIKEKLREDADSEIATTVLRVSLNCPLGQTRMLTPVRASTCVHLQCFDGSLYLQLNEMNSKWICPVCYKPALYDQLIIDGYFHDLLHSSNLPADTKEIQFHQDGSWSTQTAKKPKTIPPATEQTPQVTVNEVAAGVDKDRKAHIVEDSNASVVIEDSKPTASIEDSKASLIEDTMDSILEEDVKPVAELKQESSRKRSAIVVDLTVSSDTDDDLPLVKRQAVLTKQQMESKNSPQRLGRTNCGVIRTACEQAYLSPQIITLDSSPSPSSSPSTPSTEPSALSRSSTVCANPFFEPFSDSSTSSSNTSSND